MKPGCRRRFRCLAAAFIVAWAAAIVCRSAPAFADGGCRLLQYSFEPDCLVRNAAGACQFDRARPDLGPQIAVWIEDGQGAFVDTLMVTNAVALYGIGNRPGRWDLRSGPRFPYGRRPMALPVWAHRRGTPYQAVVMNDGLEGWMTFHETISSPEPYFCRPMERSEVVDAVTCASGTFRDAKGLLDRSQPPSYYPPRGDLIDWADACVPRISSSGNSCDYGDAPKFGVLNDLDAVATATPLYDQTFTGAWRMPSRLPDGDYALMLEVSKEFDSNASFSHVSYLEPHEVQYFSDFGLDGNIGQPSLVYRLPFHVAANGAIAGLSTLSAIGAGDWTGDTGDLLPVDSTISDGPGSGQGRLRVADGPGGMGRVHLVETSCPPIDCATAPAPEAPRIEPTMKAEATSVALTFRQSTDEGGPVIAYELRRAPAPLDRAHPYAPLDVTSFPRWAAAPAPPALAPGMLTDVTLTGLEPQTTYDIGLRAEGTCGWSAPTFVRVTTLQQTYTKLSGCVIATAAYGSDLEPDVALLRRQRDWLASRSGMARLAALLYGDTAPPLAALISQSDVARAVVRSVLRPMVALDVAASGAAH